MNISLEQIDEMRKRTNCSYEEAKELLEKHNGDLIEAIVEFEKKHSKGFKQKNNERSEGFSNKLKKLIHKGFKSRFIIENKDMTILNISVNIFLLIILLTLPAFWFYPVGLIVIYFMGYKIRIKKEKGDYIDINRMMDNAGNKAKTSNNNKKDDRKNTNKQNEDKDDDDYNQITIE